MKNKSAKRRQHTIWYVSGLIIGLGLICYSLVYVADWKNYRQGQTGPPTPNRVVTESISKPSEQAVADDGTYKVATDQPKKIIINSIGVNGYIQKVDKDNNSNISAPTNINYAGWYVRSTIPGQPGLSIIDGHVSGRYSPGIFANLKRMQIGQIFSVQFGDDSMRRFEVIDRRQVINSQAADFLFIKRDDLVSQLNLITCEGVYDDKSRQYKDRLVLVTKLIT